MEALLEERTVEKRPVTSGGFMYGKPYLSDRIKGLRDIFFNAKWEIDIDRMKYYTQAYKETEGQLPPMRNAKGLEKTLANMTIRIDDEELIVGAKSSKRYSAPSAIEVGGARGYATVALACYKSGKTVPEVMPDGFMGRSAEFLKHVHEFTEEEYKLITEEIFPYWDIKVPENVRSMAGLGGIFSGGKVPPMPWHHISVGLEKPLKMGLKGIAHQAADRMKELNPDETGYEKKKDFLEAVQVSCDAVIMFAARYAKMAEEKAKTAAPQRRKELLEIAERCLHVPAEPPRNFMEALQTIYLIQMAVIVSHGDAVICPGRVDQYLYPFYKEDREAGRITPEQAMEAIEEYQIKTAYSFNGPGVFTIGGVDKNGDDAVNYISHLFVEAHRNLKGLCNGIAARISEKTPRDFLTKICEVNRHTAGIAIYNDDVQIRDLIQGGGYKLEDARDWCNIGCTEITGSANNNGNTAVGLFHVPCLEMALNEGRAMMSGWQPMGVKTPPVSELKTFEDVKKAFAAQVAHGIEKTVKGIHEREPKVSGVFAQPLLSATIEGCIESATDLYAGGAKYNHATIGNQGLATQADSLTAIKWAVFDKKLITLEDLVKHLRNNFKDAEEVRQMLINAPKYGNDDPYADETALWVVENFVNELKKHKYWIKDGTLRGLMISSATHQYEGMVVGATPDGRLAGTPVSNGMSPSNAMEKNGLTAALISGATTASIPLGDGSSFNITFNPSLLQGDEQLDKFTSMVEGYLSLGGRQLNPNPVSIATLVDAQKNPGNYPELQVKVSGYSARFIDIHKSLQDDIIKRTGFEAC
ncbi:MAG: hypothetical protein FP816_00360 [Desulfobacteraceae bacterium]|nr:hypothetical protein [Desulfobacteraceae bacterium]MBU4053736.1 hypothetical protein [Pseudomonadota bacterium]